MLPDLPERVDDPRIAFVTELVRGLKAASEYPPGSPLEPEVTSKVVGALRIATANCEEVHLEISTNGVLYNGELLPFEADGVAALTGHFLNRQTKSIRIPRKTPVDDAWRFLVILGCAPDDLIRAGGPVTALADAGIFMITVEEDMPSWRPINTGPEGGDDDPSFKRFNTDGHTVDDIRPSEKTQEWNPDDTSHDNPTVELDPEQVPWVQGTGSVMKNLNDDESAELSPWDRVSQEIIEDDAGENTRAAAEGGDTHKTGMKEKKQLSMLDQITRMAIRTARPQGPDQAAVALLRAWRRIFKHENEGLLPSRPVAGTLQRIDPLIRYAILARLTGTAEGRSISALLPDGVIAGTIRDAMGQFDDFESSVGLVVTNARPGGALLVALLNGISDLMKASGRDQDWEPIRTRIDPYRKKA